MRNAIGKKTDNGIGAHLKLESLSYYSWEYRMVQFHSGRDRKFLKILNRSQALVAHPCNTSNYLGSRDQEE
jgi:hypothetical protein